MTGSSVSEYMYPTDAENRVVFIYPDTSTLVLVYYGMAPQVPLKQYHISIGVGRFRVLGGQG